MHALRFAALAACTAAAAATTAQAAENTTPTLQNKIAQCQGCHEIPGWRTAFPEVYSVPKLGGQKPAYIVAALKEYKSGARSFATMQAMVADLTEKDMHELAAYFAGKSPTAAPAPAAPAGGQQ